MARNRKNVIRGGRKRWYKKVGRLPASKCFRIALRDRLKSGFGHNSEGIKQPIDPSKGEMARGLLYGSKMVA